jgi:stage V sporulation protein AD
MGAAMAPAAADSVLSYLSRGVFSLADIDRIVTGDLGRVGSELFLALLEKEGIDIKQKHLDCGMLLYDKKTEDFHCGASGCGCSASVLACHLLPALEGGELRRILFLSTGALMSPQSTQQKHNILGVAHGVMIEREGILCS